MVFTPHIIVGAAIGAKTQDLGLIIILGFLSHFIMDKLPHWDYSWSGVRNFKKDKNFKAFFSDSLKMAADITFGLLIVFLILWYKNILSFDYLPFILFGIFISLLPDMIYGFSWLFTGKSNKYTKFIESIHYKQKEGKITFLGLLTEILTIVIAIIILLH